MISIGCLFRNERFWEYSVSIDRETNQVETCIDDGCHPGDEKVIHNEHFLAMALNTFHSDENMSNSTIHSL